MKNPIFFEHKENKNDFAFIDDKERNGTAYRVCRTDKELKTFGTIENTKLFLQAQGYIRSHISL